MWWNQNTFSDDQMVRLCAPEVLRRRKRWAIVKAAELIGAGLVLAIYWKDRNLITIIEPWLVLGLLVAWRLFCGKKIPRD